MRGTAYAALGARLLGTCTLLATILYLQAHGLHITP